ncbi:hypothetical protein B0H13DRAFT_2349937 [Mycena leptocephala]|nr:hypothetical protein B0H13DRAFT_2349937 [Mycena leptocephala]
MASSEGGDAGGERVRNYLSGQTGTTYVTHTARNSDYSQFSIAIGLLAVSHLPAHVDTDLGVRIPHFYCTACFKFYPARASSLSLLPRRRCPACASLWIFRWHSARHIGTLLPRPRSLALVLLAPSPCHARDFGARSHAHGFYILDTGLHSMLDFAPAYTIARSRTTPASDLALLPPALHCTSHAFPPLTRPSIRVGSVH